LSAIHQTSQISLNTTDLTLKDQKWQHWFVTRQHDRPVIMLRKASFTAVTKYLLA